MTVMDDRMMISISICRRWVVVGLACFAVSLSSMLARAPLASSQSMPAVPDPLQTKVVVTLSTVDPIIENIIGGLTNRSVIMAAGTDLQRFTPSTEDLAQLKEADLIVYANTGFLGFEAKIKESLPEKPSLDWPDYALHGAQLKDFPGYPRSPHGFWLGLDNAVAISRAVAAKLNELHKPEDLRALGWSEDIFDRNLEALEAGINRIREHGFAKVEAAGVEGACYVLAVPQVAYTVDNLGLQVGAILLKEDGEFASGDELDKLAGKLRSGEYKGKA